MSATPIHDPLEYAEVMRPGEYIEMIAMTGERLIVTRSGESVTLEARRAEIAEAIERESASYQGDAPSDRFFYMVNQPNGGGGLQTETFSRTRRGAIVRWLELNPDWSRLRLQDLTDADLESIWRQARQANEGRTYCIKLTIASVQGSGGNVTENDR